jgi:hypothetical protein
MISDTVGSSGYVTLNVKIVGKWWIWKILNGDGSNQNKQRARSAPVKVTILISAAGALPLEVTLNRNYPR